MGKCHLLCPPPEIFALLTNLSSDICLGRQSEVIKGFRFMILQQKRNLQLTKANLQDPRRWVGSDQGAEANSCKQMLAEPPRPKGMGVQGVGCPLGSRTRHVTPPKMAKYPC